MNTGACGMWRGVCATVSETCRTDSHTQMYIHTHAHTHMPTYTHHTHVPVTTLCLHAMESNVRPTLIMSPVRPAARVVSASYSTTSITPSQFNLCVFGLIHAYYVCMWVSATQYRGVVMLYAPHSHESECSWWELVCTDSRVCTQSIVMLRNQRSMHLMVDTIETNHT